VFEKSYPNKEAGYRMTGRQRGDRTVRGGKRMRDSEGGEVQGNTQYAYAGTCLQRVCVVIFVPTLTMECSFVNTSVTCRQWRHNRGDLVE
jgi:hypothetical protein